MLFSNKPAVDFSEAYPIGNGRLGAMIYGGAAEEKILLNQDSIWYGGFVDRINPDALENLPELRKLILSGKIKESHWLMEYAFSGTPQSQRPYQPLGFVTIRYQAGKDELRYDHRALDLENAVVSETLYTGGPERRIEKEYLSSFPDGVIAVRIRAEGRPVSASVLLTRERFYDRSGKLDDQSVFMDGSLGKDGICFCAGIRAEAASGTVRVLGEHLLVEDAEEIVLYIGGETTFYTKDPYGDLCRRLEHASRLGFEEIKSRHIRDYQSLFHRMTFRISGPDSAFLQTYFRFARYLLISGSRPGSLPANLQGIWNDQMLPPWDSKYTININTEMNYWMAERANLSECHLPLFDHLKRMHKNGCRTAEKMYGCRGFVAHHNTDIWGDCAPQDIYLPASYWVMGGAWLCTHIWNHYVYTLDLDFLREMYDILRDSVLFFSDFLIEENGEYVTCPSLSPENTYLTENGESGCICAGSSMDSQILRDLMNCFIQAAEVLKTGDPLAETAKEILEKLPEIRIGKHGQIMEWREDYEEAEPGHRHVSQLYGLYPSHQISPRSTPELARAAETTIRRRLDNGSGYTGWSCAWMICFYSRLGKGDSALAMLKKLWKESTFPNMMDCHPLGDGAVFQIDGNFGAAAAVLDMLVQVEGERIFLLPALPEEWHDGEVTGIRIPGNAEIDLKWEDNTLTECRVKAEAGLEADLIYQGQCRHLSLYKGDTFDLRNP